MKSGNFKLRRNRTRSAVEAMILDSFLWNFFHGNYTSFRVSFKVQVVMWHTNASLIRLKAGSSNSPFSLFQECPSLQTLTPLCCVMSDLKAQEFFPNMQKVSTELWKTLEFHMEGHAKYKHYVERCAHIKQPKQNKHMQMQQHLSVMSSTSSGRNLPAFRGV